MTPVRCNSDMSSTVHRVHTSKLEFQDFSGPFSTRNIEKSGTMVVLFTAFNIDCDNNNNNNNKIADATLLGAPLFPGSALDKAWDDRWEDLARVADRLREINSQDALILLDPFCSFSAPKVLHLLRCSPSVSHPSLTRFDALLQTFCNGGLRGLQQGLWQRFPL